MCVHANISRFVIWLVSTWSMRLMAINLVSMVQFSALFAICSVSYLSCSVSFLSLSPGELHMKYSQKFAFYFHFLFFYMEESKPTSAGQRQLFGRICGGHPVPLPEPICLFQPGQDANNGAVFFKKYGPKLF